MAACSGLEHIFEKPLSEAPTFLESLSPWKHIKSMKANLDDHSSFTEIFGELHFKESLVHSASSLSSSSSSSSNTTAEAGEISAIDQEKEKGYYRNSNERKQYRHNGSLSSDSLSLCTEGLGFESFDDVEEMLSHDLCSGDRHHDQDGDGDGDQRNVVRNSQHSESNRVRTSRGEFPPPISCIGRSGKPWVWFKSYREDGRFILKEVRIPTQEFLHACRHDGRLKLHFVHSDDEEVVEDEDVVQQNKEKGEEQEEERLQVASM